MKIFSLIFRFFNQERCDLCLNLYPSNLVYLIDVEIKSCLKCMPQNEIKRELKKT